MVTITTDDICPRHLNLWTYWDKLKVRHPHLKVSCFTTAVWGGEPEQDVSKNHDFKEWYLRRRSWVEICVHGLTHGYPPEFERSREEQERSLKESLEKLRGYLPERWIFKPPGYRWTPSTLEILKQYGCDYAILNPIYEIRGVKVVNSHTNPKSLDSIQNIYSELDRLLRNCECVFLSELLKG